MTPVKKQTNKIKKKTKKAKHQRKPKKTKQHVELSLEFLCNRQDNDKICNFTDKPSGVFKNNTPIYRAKLYNQRLC